MIVNFIAISPSREDQKQLYKNVRHIAGTGLGLVVVQKCVELHGDSIEIAIIPSNGTTVTIILPKVD
ncbi:MAG: ATP-binding protein [Microcystis sp.]|jgi:signal transduction histidine kinase|nr:ATP-binding protein [Microcystis sp. M53599_WE4]NCQ69029.1 ATP-binding protein [Microcystis aeruginosa W13-16]NCQ73553.1 ATP-binding protein [Microcystis aeruginosa W13-13]NCQ78043.1 ATP-binding protein [Microcystis aeruginosa W13-15]NCS38118.1 ATP-binding protein [Microcystis aeruginosa BS13-10]NCS45021.1 ATP-binding protein [Microcystis aeruginosa BS11-05]